VTLRKCKRNKGTKGQIGEKGGKDDTSNHDSQHLEKRKTTRRDLTKESGVVQGNACVALENGLFGYVGVTEVKKN